MSQHAPSFAASVTFFGLSGETSLVYLRLNNARHASQRCAPWRASFLCHAFIHAPCPGVIWNTTTVRLNSEPIQLVARVTLIGSVDIAWEGLLDGHLLEKGERQNL